jgi:WhiB family transcriptional regulator, redox-sensing transcriptional regulator
MRAQRLRSRAAWPHGEMSVQMRKLTAAASVSLGTVEPPAPWAPPSGNRPSQDFAASQRPGSGASMPSPAGGPNEGHRCWPRQDNCQVPEPRRAAETAAVPRESVPAAGLVAPPIASLGPDLPCTEEPELFFAESPDDVEMAKALCRECPARAACLAGALRRREPWGVWGGELFLQGAIVPRKRPRGRPRKTDVPA